MNFDLKKTLLLYDLNKYFGCLRCFNGLILREDSSKLSMPSLFNNDAFIIDMDCIEFKNAQLEHRTQRKSMDLCFVIEEDDRDHIVLVELRFNYKNLYNLNRLELEKKVEGSSLNLPHSRIHPFYYFVFNPLYVQEARNRLARMNPRIPNNFVATSIDEIKTLFFIVR